MSGPKSKPNFLGNVHGHGPMDPRMGIKSLDTMQADPPEELRQGSNKYFGVTYYVESAWSNNDIFRVVCFACGGLWTNYWETIQREDQALVVRPKCEGGTIEVVRPKGKVLYRCSCVVGTMKFGGQDIAVASKQLIEKSLAKDQRQAREAYEIIRARGGVAGQLDKKVQELYRTQSDTPLATPPEPAKSHSFNDDPVTEL